MLLEIEHQIELLVSGSNATLKIVDKSEKRTLIHNTVATESSKYLQIGGDEPVYVGGVPNSIKERISTQLGHVKNASSLHGCMSNFYLNSLLRNLAHADYSHKTLPGCQLKDPCNKSSRGGGGSTSSDENGGSAELIGIQCDTPTRQGSSLQYRALALPLINSKIK